MADVAIVIPTVGRPSLRVLLDSLARAEGPRPQQIVVVDDRREGEPLRADGVQVLRSGGRGPAAARNTGWHACRTEWVAFLDDDVWVTATWLADLAADLDGLAEDVVACTGRITVPLPGGRRATDWERGTAGLATARWITADMAYRRSALRAVGGFEERFRRAFREDADLALRVIGQGGRIERGSRSVVHPVRSAPWWASIAAQRGNADDALMTRRHGRDWYRRAGAARGRRPAHLAVTATAATALMQAVLRRRRSSAVASALWLAGTAQFAWARIAPGPRDAGEVARMAATSVAIPPVATAQWIRGLWQHRDVPRWRPRVAAPAVRAVLFDRDGTLVHDVPYNGRPELVRPVPGAREALARLRSAGVLTAVITNQSGVGRGLIERADVDAVNARVDELLGPFDSWQVCPHVDGDGCSCRKPRPGLVAAAARDLGVEVSECAVVGDTGADVAAGEAAGVALSVLVPNEVTLPSEIGWARYTARNLAEVVDLVLDDRVGNQEAVA